MQVKKHPRFPSASDVHPAEGESTRHMQRKKIYSMKRPTITREGGKKVNSPKITTPPAKNRENGQDKEGCVEKRRGNRLCSRQNVEKENSACIWRGDERDLKTNPHPTTHQHRPNKEEWKADIRGCEGSQMHEWVGKRATGLSQINVNRMREIPSSEGQGREFISIISETKE